MTGEAATVNNDGGFDNEAYLSDSQEEKGQVSSAKHLSDSSSSNERGVTKKELLKDEEEIVDYSCGIWKFRTNVLGKKFANLYVFSVCVGMSTLFTTMTNDVINVQLVSIERQYNIDNKEAGLFTTASKIGFMSTALFVGHFAKRVNIPIIAGLSGLIQGLLLVVPAILQFVDPYTLPTTNDNSTNQNCGSDNNKYLCHLDHSFNGTTNSNCTAAPQVKEIDQLGYSVIMVIQALKGVCESFHTGFLTALYIDDNLVNKKKMAIYLGISSFFQYLATPMGKWINGALTEVPIDLKPTDIQPKDKRFISAWWLSFLILGVGSAIFSFPVMLFPKKLVTRKTQNEALAQAKITFVGGDIEDKTMDAIKRQEGLERERQPSIQLIPSTPDVTLDINTFPTDRKSSQQVDDQLNRRTSLFVPEAVKTERKVSITGDFVFEQPAEINTGHDDSVIDLIKDFPRALLRVLKVPVFVVSLINSTVIGITLTGLMMFKSMYMANEYNVPMSEVAYVSGITTIIGSLGGTIISSFLASKVKTLTGFGWLLTGTSAFIMGFTPLSLIFGCGNIPVYGAKGSIGLPVNVSSACDCSLDQQLLSCGNDNNNYYSPCFAGCIDVDGQTFKNCSLLTNTTIGTVTSGLCDTDCHNNFLLYAGIDGAQYLVSSILQLVHKVMILRIMEPRDRSFGSSLFMFWISLMGLISPNVFGTMIDNTCLIWSDRVCSLYDRDILRYTIAGIDVAVHVFLFTVSLFTIRLLRWQENMERKRLTGAENNNKKGARNGMSVAHGEGKQE